MQLGVVSYWVTSALYLCYHSDELFVMQLCVCWAGGEGGRGGRGVGESRGRYVCFPSCYSWGWWLTGSPPLCILGITVMSCLLGSSVCV